jgi:hypothetical protein
MDGAGWFGEGHWFVAIGYDRNGVLSARLERLDTRFLTWSWLYAR